MLLFLIRLLTERLVNNIYEYKVNAFLTERRGILNFLKIIFSLIAYYSSSCVKWLMLRTKFIISI